MQTLESSRFVASRTHTVLSSWGRPFFITAAGFIGLSVLLACRSQPRRKHCFMLRESLSNCNSVTRAKRQLELREIHSRERGIMDD
ncbi:uncharacterized protein BO96DRAFT_412002 [Aspergillus niger CBS 101883]|uniref:uncharacterized protein n=1 Tax=Aspergillus lacticoffeatus (strain CBS 101883) TaxID=1450533 RepID=UPI000D7F2DDD|nr:uncharacterized protein BO96DRAFT_412002 [Aspergillus niger CBS 101883]PYH57012.1 hypothetical protein BO96DRAFT_412002 [Aspergillus niger CBS 101883]